MAASSEIASDRKCPIHGLPVPIVGSYEFQGKQRPSYGECPKCQAQARDDQDRTEREREAARLDNAGLVGRFRYATFGSFEVTHDGQRSALEACKAFAETAAPGKWQTLLLLGPVGVGKSHLLAAIVNAASAQRGMGARFISASQVIAAVRGTWRRNSEVTEEQVIAGLATTRMLAIDEIGAGCNSASEQKVIFDLIDQRYALQYPTALASNLSPPGLRAALGERTFDRLREASHVVPMAWESMRGRA